MLKKRKLAVVTTYDELCGIAGFSRCLVRALEPHFDLKVFDLDQFLLRQTDGLGRRKADKHFKAICRKLAKFDVVNLQLEFGTLGALEKDIFRRLSWLCKAAPELSVTFHTVPRKGGIDWEVMWSYLRQFRLGDALNHVRSQDTTTARRTYSMLRKYARFRRLTLIVHTRRDRRYLEVVQDFKHVYDHPLSFLQLEDVSKVLEDARREPFSSLVKVPEGVKAIGVFGFLSSYKGFETAIRALRYLPEDHHLYIFGGVHPNDIPEKRIQTYVKQLMGEVSADYTLLDRLLGKKDASEVDPTEMGGAKDRSAGSAAPVHLTLDSVAHATDLVKGLTDSLVNRVHFVGALSDDQFYAAMASCDIVVLPYQEVMQSSSGPASLAIELGRRTLLSRTRGFLQLGRYFPNRLEFFDVGNHFQLASLIKDDDRQQSFPERPVSMETLCQMYVSAHSGRRTTTRETSVDKDAVVTSIEAPEKELVEMSVGAPSVQIADADALVSEAATRNDSKLEKRLLKRGFLKRAPVPVTAQEDRPSTH